MSTYYAVNINDPEDQCVYCLGDDPPLIKPCPCSQFHRECLDTNRARGVGNAMNECQTCKFEYVIEVANDDPVNEQMRLLKYRLYMARDITLCVFVLLLAFSSVGILSYELDTNDNLYNFLCNRFITNKYVLYGMFGMFVWCAIIGLVGSIYFCCMEARGGGPPFCDCPGGADCGGEGCLIFIVVALIIFALAGLIMGIFGGFYVIVKIMDRNKRILWNTQEVTKYVVKDFTGKDAEMTALRQGQKIQHQQAQAQLHAPHHPPVVHRDRPRGY